MKKLQVERIAVYVPPPIPGGGCNAEFGGNTSTSGVIINPDVKKVQIAPQMKKIRIDPN
jgi:hypothetical protein